MVAFQQNRRSTMGSKNLLPQAIPTASARFKWWVSGIRKAGDFTPNCGGKATCSRFSKYLLLELRLPVCVFLRCDPSGFQLVSLRGPGLEHLGRLGCLLGRRIDRKTRAVLGRHDAELILQLQKEAQEVSGVLHAEVLQGKRRDVEGFGDGFDLRLLGSCLGQSDCC